MDRIDREDAATAVEYGLLLASIAAVVVATVTFLGQDTLALFQTMDGAF